MCEERLHLVCGGKIHSQLVLHVTKYGGGFWFYVGAGVVMAPLVMFVG
jgi:hypothetical protein